VLRFKGTAKCVFVIRAVVSPQTFSLEDPGYAWRAGRWRACSIWRWVAAQAKLACVTPEQVPLLLTLLARHLEVICIPGPSSSLIIHASAKSAVTVPSHTSSNPESLSKRSDGLGAIQRSKRDQLRTGQPAMTTALKYL